jgi:hypothetical protein
MVDVMVGLHSVGKDEEFVAGKNPSQLPRQDESVMAEDVRYCLPWSNGNIFAQHFVIHLSKAVHAVS